MQQCPTTGPLDCEWAYQPVHRYACRTTRSIRQNRMRRRGRWGWPAPGGVAGLREVDGRYLRGSSQVDRGHEPCWQIAARMARHVMRRASCPRCPRAASLFAGIRPASGQWRDRGRTARTSPAVPVPGSPGNLWRGCERWPCRSDFQGGTLSGACTAGGSGGHRLRQAGGSAACPAGSRTAVGQ